MFSLFIYHSICTRKSLSLQLKNLELSGRKVNVALNQPVTRIFLGNIPKSKTKEEILDELNTQGRELLDWFPIVQTKYGAVVGDGLSDVIVYSSTDGGATKNRGFCFADYNDHKSVPPCIVSSLITLSRTGVRRETQTGAGQGDTMEHASYSGRLGGESGGARRRDYVEGEHEVFIAVL